MPGGVLVVTAAPGLAGQVRRLCALAGGGCDVERESGAVRGAWRQAGLVLVGEDLAAAVAAAGLPRRERIFVVSEGQPDAPCWNAALALGARRVLTLPADQADLVDELRGADQPDHTLGQRLGVIGGCGGAGASTFAAALALTAADAAPTVLVDGDPLGGGLDVLLGAEEVAGLRWSDLAGTQGRLDPAAFAHALCRIGGMSVLAWGRTGKSADASPSGVLTPAAAVQAALDAASQAFTTVVVDLPRYAGPVGDRLFDAVDATVLIVPAEVRAVAASASLLAAIDSRLVAPQLVVRESGSGLSARDVAASLGLELVATVRSESAVQHAGQRGELPIHGRRGSLANACEVVLSRLGSQSVAR
jgi:secretion/DNA translocation related CpaE-like protein